MIQLLTSAEAAKLLKKLKEEHQSIQNLENESYEYVAAISEIPGDVAPNYNFTETQQALTEIETKIRKIKHAINVFNTTHTVPNFPMTVDELLVYSPQLTALKTKYGIMKNKLPKARVRGYSNAGVIEYKYANYAISDAEREYELVSEQLAQAQLALDTLNNTVTMEIDI